MVGIDIATIVAVLTGITSLVVSLSTRRKNQADAASAVTDAAMKLVMPLSDRVAALEGEVATLRKRVAEFRRGVRLLCEQISDLGGAPVWQEPDNDAGDDSAN